MWSCRTSQMLIFTSSTKRPSTSSGWIVILRFGTFFREKIAEPLSSIVMVIAASMWGRTARTMSSMEVISMPSKFGSDIVGVSFRSRESVSGCKVLFLSALQEPSYVMVIDVSNHRHMYRSGPFSIRKVVSVSTPLSP